MKMCECFVSDVFEHPHVMALDQAYLRNMEVSQRMFRGKEGSFAYSSWTKS